MNIIGAVVSIHAPSRHTRLKSRPPTAPVNAIREKYFSKALWLLLFSSQLAPFAFAQDFNARESEFARSSYEHRILQQINYPMPALEQDTALEYIGRWGLGACGGVAAMGNYVFTGNGPTLLWLDVTNRQRPVVVWDTLMSGILTKFIIQDSIGYALVAANTLLIVDFRNPRSPRIRAELGIIGGLLDLVVEGSLAFAKRYYGYLYCIDISNLSAPFVRSVVRETSIQWGTLAISNRHLYIGDQGNNPMEYADVSNPDSIRITPLFFTLPYFVTAAYARDTLLFVNNGIYSITTPHSPVRLANISITSPNSIAMRGDTAFFGNNNNIITTVDISNPRNPIGVWIFQYKAGNTSVREEGQPVAKAIRLLSNYPNPFNTTTQLRFAISTSQKVRMEIFDLLGKHVAILLNNMLESGEHTIEFDARDLPSGIYFYKLQTATSLVGKMILIK